jgi:hypothetical protein
MFKIPNITFGNYCVLTGVHLSIHAYNQLELLSLKEKEFLYIILLMCMCVCIHF